jgi:hypothetical protein
VPLTYSRRELLIGAAALTLAGCHSGHSTALPAAPPLAPGELRPLVIGCIAPFTGPYSSVGQVVSASLLAATSHLRANPSGSYSPQLVTADAPVTAADGQAAYAQLKAKQVDAVLWCGAQGLLESLPAIVADLTPVIAVGTDIQSRVLTSPSVPDLTTAAAAGFPVFQQSMPDVGAVELLIEYAIGDRGFDRLGLVFSTSSSPGIDGYFTGACSRLGVDAVAVLGYDSSNGPPDLRQTAIDLVLQRPHAVIVVGAAPEAASLATELSQMGHAYIDTPTAKGSHAAPMVLGVPAATGSAVFTRLAGTAATRGTVGATLLGSVVALPGAGLRSWVHQFAPSYNGGLPQGGEDGPADAIAALLAAASTAGSADGADLVAALEGNPPVAFSSPVPIGFGMAQHLSALAGAFCLQTVESLPAPGYDLGADWGTIFPAGYRAPDLLVDFTDERNRQAYPAVAAQVASLRYGVSAQPSYQGGSQDRIEACERIH